MYLLIKVNDIVLTEKKCFRVTGVYLAPPNGTSSVGLKPISLNKEQPEFRVPLELIESFGVYRKVEDTKE